MELEEIKDLVKETLDDLSNDGIVPIRHIEALLFDVHCFLQNIKEVEESENL